MRPIPQKLRAQLAADPFMARCVWGCSGKPEWEHVFVYGGRQVNERWAIIPLCYFHHRGGGLDKRLNELVALLRATPEELSLYPKKDWDTLLRWRKKEYPWYKLPKI